MSAGSIEFQTLLAYNHAGAERWHAYFVQHPEALNIDVGGKMPKVRDLVAHIFEVEFYFASELDTPGANYTQLNPASLDEMFAKHEEAHGLLARYLETANSEEEMRKMHIFKRGDKEYQRSSRKLLIQIVWHGINHWGQIAMLVRRAGLETGPPHDIIASSVLQ
jgi:uncharacterized damage-inducible protein DinB